MAGKTSNYNLTKPFEEEGVDINVINQNMDTIDTNLKSISDDLNSTKAQIPPLIGIVYETDLNNTLSSYAKKTDVSLSAMGVSATSTELNYTKGLTSNIIDALNGKASTNHGTHVTYHTGNPSANGNASAGTSNTVSRGDHVHPLQTSVTGSSGSCTGNSATATKATQDASGNVITTSYASSASLSGNNLLIKSKSGATLSTVDLSGFSNNNVSSGTKMYYTTTEPTGKNGEIWIA